MDMHIWLFFDLECVYEYIAEEFRIFRFPLFELTSENADPRLGNVGMEFGIFCLYGKIGKMIFMPSKFL